MNSRFSEFRAARRFRVINRLAQIILSVSLVVALNFLSSAHFKRIDLTDSGAYTLAPESKAYIRALQQPVNIIITIPRDPESPELSRIHRDLSKLLREYEYAGLQRGVPFINVEYVDIYRQRKRAAELANEYGISQENVILFVSGNRVRIVRQADLYEVKGNEIRGFRGERAFTSAILDASSVKTERLYFLVGHGEMRLDDFDALRGLSQMESFLRERNFSLGTLDLSLEASVPEDASMVIIPSPQASLSAEEVEKLRRYMSDRNGRMMLLLDPGRRHGLDDLLYDWGIMVDDMAVIDAGPDYRAQGGDLIIRRFAEHPITELLIDYQITALFGPPRPVRTDPASLSDERVQVTQLVGTSENSWAERDFRTQSPPKFDPDRDLPGPVSIAAVSTRSAGTELGITIPGGRLVVFGNSDFIANNRLRAFGNQTLFINSLNWALDRTTLLNIPTRAMESYQIVISEQNLNRLLLYFFALPAAVAILGILVFIIRRR